MATWGEGYIAASVPPAMAAQGFDGARSAWQAAGRAGAPRLVVICYFVFGDGDAGRSNVADYYAGAGEFTDMVVNNVRVGADSVREAVKEFGAIGAEELILNPTAVVCPSGQGTACKAVHTGSNPVAASRSPSAVESSRPDAGHRTARLRGNVTPVSSSETVHRRCWAAWSWESGLEVTSFGYPRISPRLPGP